MEKDCDVIIIGAGASGLMAAYELGKKGKKVILLEARDYAGGRIFTLHDNEFSGLVETGAEFIHGDMKVTFALLKEANIKYHTVKGEMFRVEHGEVKHENNFIEGWRLFGKKLKEVKRDMTVDAFLEKYFNSPEHKAIKKSVTQFVEGYDTADTDKASILAFKQEWEKGQDSDQYRINNGYSRLIDFLKDEFIRSGGEMHLSAVVKEIRWKKNNVKVLTAAKKIFSASRVIVTVPISVLTGAKNKEGHINFTPAIPKVITAAKDVGYGSVVKILFEFNSPFWLDEQVKKQARITTNKLGFIFSGKAIPTWWTQYPMESSLLTGWIGGPAAKKLAKASEKKIYKMAVESLAFVFKLSGADIEKRIRAKKIINWTTETFTMGSYAYTTTKTNTARKILNRPVGGTIYFAGEACYEGPEMGTVEAALASGKDVAGKLL